MIRTNARRRKSTLALGVVVALGIVALPTPAFAVPPANDNFANREMISTFPFTGYR